MQIIKNITVSAVNYMTCNTFCSFFKLQSNDFFDVGRKIASINLPTLFVMEGGYAIKEIGVNTVNTLKGFEEN